MPVLFISRGTMSGVKELVKQFHTTTGIRCISREDLLTVVAKHGEWAIEAVKKLSDATLAYEQFSQLRRVYVILMRQALLGELQQQDDVLYHGFSGHLLVPRIRHFVRIRIEAPLELRIPPTMKRLDCDEQYARKYIHETDEQRVRWARFTYGRDIRDSSLYGLCVNLVHLPMTAVCGILKHLMSEPEFQANEESKDQFEQILLSTNVEAALVSDPQTRHFEIHAKIEKGNVHLIGPYLRDSDRTRVLAVAGEVANTGKIEYTPGYVPTFDFAVS